MRNPRPISVATGLLLATLLPLSAAAQPDPGEPEEPAIEEPSEPSAQDLREQAHEALDLGQVDKACKLLRQSHDQDANEDVLFELAECQERAGDKDVALKTYQAIAAAGGARSVDAARRANRLEKKEKPAGESETGAAETSTDGAKGEAAAEVEGEAADEPKKEAEEDESPYSPFMDTRLTWTFGDDDVLHQTGQAVPLSPNAAIGDRKQYRLFFDNLNSRFGGRENLTHLVLYKKMPGFIDRLDTEASMVLRFDLGELSKNSNNVNRALYDSGSFIRLFYRLGDDADDDKTGLGLTFWPLDTDRFRLGYLYDISWGGTNAAINQSIFPRIQGTAPGAKLQFNHERFSIFAGFKTAQIVQVEETLTPGTGDVEVIRVGQSNYGVLGGGGVQIIDNLRLDAGGGYFQQGKFDLPDVAGEQVYTFGASARIVVHHEDYPAPDSVDFLLYRNDPNKPLIIFKQTKYDPDATTWNVSVEANHLWQNLKDFEETGATRLQPARAVALQGNLKTGYLRLSLTGIYRDLAYVLRNVPSFVPFETLPEEAETGDELFFAFAGDYHIDSVKLTPGLGAGLQLPATFKTSSVDVSGNTIGRTVVVRQQGNLAILPVDRDSVPIFQARASLRWDISTILSAVVWAQYVRDNNGTFVERDPNEGTVALRTFISPDFFGFGTSMQARF
ncbi:MAG: hypothetical protein JRI23_20225 [Deltaproteobacteria bacterium]|jgi:hypothetical protein|nr:hypothetical protein [Deltaproteobacteria bacterium]MBW2534213.1 hypothetical protein [Deltaproteobacteria bacterium]